MTSHLNNLLLLADLGDVIGAIIALIVPLLWVVKQIFDGAKAGNQPRKQAAPPPQRQQAAQPAAAGGGQADPLRSQVEEFLRRAGRAPQQEGARPAESLREPKPARTSQIEVLLDEDLREVPERRPLGQPLRPAGQPLSSQREELPRAAWRRKPRLAGQSPPSRESVAEHVAETMGTHSRTIGEQTSRLGHRIIEDDHQFDVQLKAKFDHTVGTLAPRSVTAAEQAAIMAASAVESPASQIAAMLSNPEGVRQAIVVNEIIRRPADRW